MRIICGMGTIGPESHSRVGRGPAGSGTAGGGTRQLAERRSARQPAAARQIVGAQENGRQLRLALLRHQLQQLAQSPPRLERRRGRLERRGRSEGADGGPQADGGLAQALLPFTCALRAASGAAPAPPAARSAAANAGVSAQPHSSASSACWHRLARFSGALAAQGPWARRPSPAGRPARAMRRSSAASCNGAVQSGPAMEGPDHGAQPHLSAGGKRWRGGGR